MKARFGRSAGWTLIFLSLLSSRIATGAAASSIGVARIDVTPAEPIRLTGYAVRQTNSMGVEQKIWAKALAIGSDAEGPALLMTLDNCGIAEDTYKELVRRLAKKARIKQERLAISCSHTHSGPCTTGWAPNIFAQDIPPEQQAVIDRYTRDLLDKLEQVALAALNDRRPGKLSWTLGSVDFALNRRMVQARAVQFGDNGAGPVDHALPVLLATDDGGQVRALVANYACHCTTIGGEFNKLCGDWAGFAQEYLERDHPGAIALITIGCGADSNPSPRGGADGGLALARQHGEEIAAEVKRLLTQSSKPLSARLTTHLKHVELPFDPLFSRTQWEERAQKPGIVGYHAKKNLARLDRGEPLPKTLSYYAQTWNFGDDLAMVFLSGEVVVDYALRLKQEFDPSRLWVTAYANYVQCYIPSRRILKEGGYEAEDSLWYYDRPARISTNAEDLIIKTVHEMLPKSVIFDKKKAEFPSPKTVEQALASFRTKADLTVELAAAEPLIESPVAIDWGTDGRLWVCEMYDYPTGLDGKWKPGGRIKVLQDTDADGRYDKSTLFLDQLPFPTGLMAWRKGVLICAAPDILYAEDTDGDGKADVVEKLYSGFATHNFQARVNGLTWGLDGWVYGASGLFGGKVRSLLTGQEVDLSGRDFRIKPDTGEIEPVAGISQQGRIRDDWGNWFGNDNSTLLWNFPLPDHYIRRNPYVSYPDPRVNVATVSRRRRAEGSAPQTADPNQLFPISRTLERFNDPQSANRTTSACGPEIYRADLLGANFYGNAFICEPVHNLVTRLVLQPQSASFAASRAADERSSEFLASTDNWFRPVQVRTGPDGALWIVDMYRFVVEHPRWIPPPRLKQLDVRAGADQGRIYRVYPRGTKLGPIRDLTKLTTAQVVEALDSPNGPARDLAHLELVWRAEGKAQLEQRVKSWSGPEKHPGATPNPTVRAQMLCALAGLGGITPELLAEAMADPHPGVRSQAVRLSEPLLEGSSLTLGFNAALRALADDPEPSVRFQLALSLGQSKQPLIGMILGKLALTDLDDRWLRSAVLCSATSHAGAIFDVVSAATNSTAARQSFARELIASASGSPAQFKDLFISIARMQTKNNPAWNLELLASVLDALERKNETLASYSATLNHEAHAAALELERVFAEAQKLALDETAPVEVRKAAIPLLARRAQKDKEIELLGKFLQPGASPQLQQAALERLKRLSDPEVSPVLLRNWPAHSPSQRTAILAVLLSREEWVKDLLRAVEQGTVSAAEIPLANRQQLLKSGDTSVRERAVKLLQPSAKRTDVLARYQSVPSLSPFSERGAGHFDKKCASCHAYRGHGQAVGPNLAEFAGKSLADFLVAILDPNAAINPNFLAYNIETKDGRSLIGIVKGETASSLTLMQGGGVAETILRSDVQEIRASQLSLMPEGLEQNMSQQDLADLIGWLKQGVPPLFGSATAEQANSSRRQFLQQTPNGPGKVVAASEQLNYPSWLGPLPLFHCRQTDGNSQVTWQAPSLPANLPPSSAQRFHFAAAMGFLSQPAGKFQLRLNGRPVLDFDVSLTDQTFQSEDCKVRMLYTVMERNAEDSNGPLEIEVANSLLDPGKPATFSVIGSASGSQRWFGIYLVPEMAQAARRGQ